RPSAGPIRPSLRTPQQLVFILVNAVVIYKLSSGIPDRRGARRSKDPEAQPTGRIVAALVALEIDRRVGVIETARWRLRGREPRALVRGTPTTFEPASASAGLFLRTPGYWNSASSSYQLTGGLRCSQQCAAALVYAAQ